jgi:hypothetical protein
VGVAANDPSQGPARARLVLKILMALAVLLLAWAAFFVSDALATERSKKAIRDFRGDHPCPATGNIRGACPGYVVDHIRPLCAGGPDQPSNMQWQTVPDAKKKDRLERQECRAVHKTKF